ncbi:hypothetical protein Q666_14145 [Marinobacter sp. ES-1]|nr:hypothetical protein Q666_14145 [Marinobacter sp. ES-1]
MVLYGGRILGSQSESWITTWIPLTIFGVEQIGFLTQVSSQGILLLSNLCILSPLRTYIYIKISTIDEEHHSPIVEITTISL